MNQVIDATVLDIFEALKKNGFEHLRETWIGYGTEGKGACVLGQAALNLGVADHEETAMDIVDGNKLPNKMTKYSIYGQLNQWAYTRKKWLPENSVIGTRNGLADIIIYWNDKHKDDGWELETYEEVVAMAEEVLRPFFAKKVKLFSCAY